ncbi:MAG: tRNA uridine-5-carboxymethylaminomethyl(34) synthesis GTPase MnmE [Dehalococcoidia bacterium]|nr:tRNA uridine-5-carboxymethylaminomethyl(34) synthesis GTPase MnmE [Dehalococcoidia bacterium]
MYRDTIAAISTPLGEGGIGIVRISGPGALAVTKAIFRGKLADRQLSYGKITDPETGEHVDEVLVSYMAAPRTYTREDVVEINCHGGPLPLRRVLQLALRHGARLARPGEFTLRAFLNGRIDLAQAESVLDVIRARTDASLRIAVQGLDGRLSSAVKDLRTSLLSALAYLTARIDFPEDEIPPQDVAGPLNEALRSVRRLIATADAGMVYRCGVKTAIVGRPNVGKSSLLNRLLREDRAIVTPIPGTTRDTIEEVANIGGVPFVLVDTAGIVHSKDLAESLGVERSQRAVAQADLVLLMIDVSQPIADADREIAALTVGKATLVVANKSDLPRQAHPTELGRPVVHTSALTGEGLDRLEDEMLKLALGGAVVVSDAPMVSNPRHKDALERAARSLDQALQDLRAGMPDDFITIHLTASLSALGEITGETVQEHLLDTIFANFCIGK